MKNHIITRLAICSFLLFLATSKSFAGGSSVSVRILSLTETKQDRYTMVIEQLPSDKTKTPAKKIILRLRHNEYYFTKNPTTAYSLKLYRKSIDKLKGFYESKRVSPLGSMGGVWGIPVGGKKNEFWVQTLAIFKEHGGEREVVYTIKE